MSDKTKELIINALKYYDLNNGKYFKIFDKIKYYSIVRSESDLEHNIVIFYDKHKNVILQSKYEILGIYNSDSNLWAWSWAMPSYQKNEVYLARKILNYGLDLIPHESLFLKSELITSRFKINDVIQLDIHAAIASYISKNPIVYKLIFDPTKTNNNDRSDMYETLDEITPTSIVWFFYLLDEEKLSRIILE